MKKEIIKETIVLTPLGKIIDIIEKIVKTWITIETDNTQEKKNMTVLGKTVEIEIMTEILWYINREKIKTEKKGKL